MGVGQMVCPEVSREEIVNACGTCCVGGNASAVDKAAVAGPAALLFLYASSPGREISHHVMSKQCTCCSYGCLPGVNLHVCGHASAGVDDLHDGVNFVRTACVIAIAKSKEIFEPLIHQVRGQGEPYPCASFAPLIPIHKLKASACTAPH